jgi:hypothetical protein
MDSIFVERECKGSFGFTCSVKDVHSPAPVVAAVAFVTAAVSVAVFDEQDGAMMRLPTVFMAMDQEADDVASDDIVFSFFALDVIVMCIWCALLQ